MKHEFYALILREFIFLNNYENLLLYYKKNDSANVSVNFHYKFSPSFERQIQ